MGQIGPLILYVTKVVRYTLQKAKVLWAVFAHSKQRAHSVAAYGGGKERL